LLGSFLTVVFGVGPGVIDRPLSGVLPLVALFATGFFSTFPLGTEPSV